MKRIKNNKTYSFKETIKKSIFITIIEVINSNDELEKTIEKHFDNKASHNAYAYSFIENNVLFKSFKDDGEPHGTAGKPILNIIESNEMQNILVFVKRYFGGVKLGLGGLSRAYCSGFIHLLKNEIELKEIKEMNFVVATYDIKDVKKAQALINALSPIDQKMEYVDSFCKVSFYTETKEIDKKNLLTIFKEVTVALEKR